MAANTTESRIPVNRPKTLLLVDQPNLITMEKFNGRSITPSHIMSLAKTRGDVVYARVFTDSFRLTDTRQFKDWLHAGFHVEFCVRYGRPNHERETAAQANTKESVDVTLIDYAHKIIQLIRPKQFILVAGDSDYVPLARSIAHTGVAVRVFLTAPCGLLEPLLAEHLLTEVYTLYAAENPMEVTYVSLFQRMSVQQKDVYDLSARDQEELDRLCDARVKCLACNAEVEIGLWKAHPCHPNPVVIASRAEANSVAVPTVKDSKPAFPSLLPSVNVPLESAAQDVNREPFSLNRDRWDRLRQEARSLPRNDAMTLAHALINASSEVSLAWLTDDDRVSRTMEEIFALKRIVNKEVDCPVVTWLRVIRLIHIHFTEPYTVREALIHLKAMAGKWMFDDALSLLIDEGVLRENEISQIERGSLVRPAFRFVCHRLLLEEKIAP